MNRVWLSFASASRPNIFSIFNNFVFIIVIGEGEGELNVAVFVVSTYYAQAENEYVKEGMYAESHVSFNRSVDR